MKSHKKSSHLNIKPRRFLLGSRKKSSHVNMPYFPDELLLNCLARVSRFHYPIISLVSKRFRSLIASPELYQTRTLLGHTEDCLYVCLRLSSERRRWFPLCQTPTRNPNPNVRWSTPCSRPHKIIENKSSDYDILNSTAIGSNIYTIVKHNRALSSSVFFMECRFHTWNQAPSMQIERDLPLVSVLDGKMYVVEGRNNSGSSDLMEIFDPETGWSDVPYPRAEILGRHSTLKSLSMDGKLYLFGEKIMSYNPQDNKWDDDVLDVELYGMRLGSYCVIDNVLYCSAMSRVLQWYDFEGRLWKDVKGFGELPECLSIVRLVNYGGNLALLWENKVCADENSIWCAVVALERRNGQEIYGKLERCDNVLTVPRSCSLLECLVVNV